MVTTTRFHRTSGRALAVLALAAAAVLANGAAAQGTPARASQLIGKVAQDARGKDLGEVKDLIIDTSEGRVASVVLSVGAYLGGGREQLVALPLPSPEVRLDGERLVVSEPRARLAELPAFTSQEWPDLNPGEPAGPAGLRFRRASEMIAADLKSLNGKDVGHMRDLLVTLEDGQLRAFVVEFDPTWYDKPGWVALPRESIRYSAADYVANFEPEAMMTPAEAKAARERAEKARAEAAAQAANLDREERASAILGMKVLDRDGAAVGEVRDLVVDTRAGNLVHMVIAAGGYLGVGDRLVTLPLPVEGATRAAAGGIKLAMDKARIAALPGFASTQWPDFNANDGTQRLRRVSTLLDTKLADARGKEVGDLRDIVVNLGRGKVRYAVAEFDPNWVQAGKVVAVPLRGVEKGKGDLRMRVELNQLQGAMIFDKGAWPNIDDAGFRAYMDKYLSQN